MTQPGLLVADASPLITLAAEDALDCLTMPGLRLLIPDMVYFEVMQDLARTGAAGVVEWARRHPGQVEIVPTTRFAEFQTLRAADPATRSRGRGELAALEVLNTEIDRTPDLEAVLLFEDNDVRTRRFVRALPERVTALSTGDLLHELEAAGRIQSSDHILGRAAEKAPNVERQRPPSVDDAARHALRRQSQSPDLGAGRTRSPGRPAYKSGFLQYALAAVGRNRGGSVCMEQACPQRQAEIRANCR